MGDSTNVDRGGKAACGRADLDHRIRQINAGTEREAQVAAQVGSRCDD